LSFVRIYIPTNQSNNQTINNNDVFISKLQIILLKEEKKNFSKR